LVAEEKANNRRAHAAYAEAKSRRKLLARDLGFRPGAGRGEVGVSLLLSAAEVP